MLMRKFGPIQQKILITLLGGVALGLSETPRQYFRTLKALRKEWKRINQQSFNRSVTSLYQQKLLKEINRPNGSITLQLTEQGVKQANYFGLFGNAIRIRRPKKWDGLWRLIIFDIPEKKRHFRNILREHLKAIGFKELQHSVFIFPYPCEKELACIVELYNATPYVRIITARHIDNQKELVRRFSIK